MTMRIVKPATGPEKQTRTTMDTLELTQKLVASWKSPPFQRPLRINKKVVEVTEGIRRDGGVIPGIITIGVLDGDTYVVDGQHRLAAWLQTALDFGYADVRMHWFDTMGEMAEEFCRLNGSIVKMRPDDILRGMEPSTVALQRLRKKCGFLGYDMVRRGDRSPVLSMSVFVRCWVSSIGDVPNPSGGSALQAVTALDEQDTTHAIDFITLCYEAWGRDVEYGRLWGILNLSLCAWLYRRVVLGIGTSNYTRAERLTKEDFRKLLMAASAENQYLDYLVGRNSGDRDRAPAYQRLKNIFGRRYLAETGKKLKLPQPAWAHGKPRQG